MVTKAVQCIGYAAVTVFILGPGAEAAVYSGGAGIEPNPYRIGNTADWSTLAYTPGDWDKYFILITDIDFGGADVTPVGTHDQPFIGGFNGDGHIGLFCVLGEGGTIHDLGVEALEVAGYAHVGGLVGENDGGEITSCHFTGAVSGNSVDVGGLAGTNMDGTITSCYAAGTVAGLSSTLVYSSFGGLVGMNDGGEISSCHAETVFSGPLSKLGGLVGTCWEGAITSCRASGTFSEGRYYVGGLVGSCFSSTIQFCHATGPVGGGDAVGGLLGESMGDTVTFCYATGAVSAEIGDAGGLIGAVSGCTVISCYAAGDVTGKHIAGGLIGHTSANAAVVSCYARGAVSGTDSVGGLVGLLNYTLASNCYAEGTVTADHYAGGLVGIADINAEVNKCYARGAVTGGYSLGGLVGHLKSGTVWYSYATGAVSGDTDTGGLVGTSYDTVNYSYWDKTTSGHDVSAGGEGRTTAEMTYPHSPDTYVVWDFTTVWAADTAHTINDGYPYLIQNIPPTPHPADLNVDFHVVMSEAIAYLTGWQQGSNPMAYAIRAAYLWQNGEAYVYSGDSDPPLCWRLAP